MGSPEDDAYWNDKYDELEQQFICLCGEELEEEGLCEECDG